MGGEKIAFGKWGEQKACLFLEGKGYEILERNFKCKIGEVDIIAKKDDNISFVEVKTRCSIDFGLPCEAVNRKKRSKIIRTAQSYIKQHKEYIYFGFYLDVIEVLTINDGIYINHICCAFCEGE